MAGTLLCCPRHLPPAAALLLHQLLQRAGPHWLLHYYLLQQMVQHTVDHAHCLPVGAMSFKETQAAPGSAASYLSCLLLHRLLPQVQLS